MAGHDAVGAIANTLSDVTRFSNPAVDPNGPEVSLSEMAQGILNNISDLQSGFDQTIPSGEQAHAVPKADPAGESAATGNDAVADSMQALVHQMDQSMAVQQQLTRFVMASSVSSSLGRNLNMFLRGQ